jgi:ribosome assembly protein 1
MPVVPPERLIQLQQAADNVRNICIMAHVVSVVSSSSSSSFSFSFWHHMLMDDDGE